MSTPPPTDPNELRDARRRLQEFLHGTTDERFFRHPTGHPSRPTGFCFCDQSAFRAAWFYLKAICLMLVFALPFNRLKVWMLRRRGAKIGRRVYFSHGVWIDPMFPQLLAIEDDVFFGMGAKLFTHEFRIDEFRAGRVIVRRGAFVGAFAVVPCGTEIGEEAVVAACTVVHRDVPPGATIVPPLARIVHRQPAEPAREETP